LEIGYITYLSTSDVIGQCDKHICTDSRKNVMDSGITINSGYSDSGYLDSGSLQNSIVKSPGQRSTFSISLEEGKIYYSATQDGKTIIEKSPIGMVTTLGDFSEGITYKSTSEVKEINETYKMYSGKKAEYQDHANEVTYTFTKGDMEFDVIVRAYDDGIAYRYGIRNSCKLRYYSTVPCAWKEWRVQP